MGLIDGADKNLDVVLAPSNPMLEPPLNNSVLRNIANLIITASLLLNIPWMSTISMDMTNPSMGISMDIDIYGKPEFIYSMCILSIQ